MKLFIFGAEILNNKRQHLFFCVRLQTRVSCRQKNKLPVCSKQETLPGRRAEFVSISNVGYKERALHCG